MATSINFPSWLNHIEPQVSGFSHSEGGAKVEAQFQSGQTFAKEISIKVPETFSAVFLLTAYERRQLILFYRQRLQNGTLTFNWRHPISGASIECMFRGSPGTSSAGGAMYQVACAFEIVDEN